MRAGRKGADELMMGEEEKYDEKSDKRPRNQGSSSAVGHIHPAWREGAAGRPVRQDKAGLLVT
jgi:hypothetical protein